jgi:peptidoglycan hydrolase-like protein with peptidoglycan-binding domain
MEVFDPVHEESTHNASPFIQCIEQQNNHLSLNPLAAGLLAIATTCTLLGIAPATAFETSSFRSTVLTQPSESNLIPTAPLLLSQDFGGFGLQVGDSGDAVADLQQRLADLGYYTGVVDGSFGPQTEAAVIQFQLANGLEGDGVVGPATQAALDGAASPPPASPVAETPIADDSGLLQLNTSGDRVLALQTRLRDLGYYSGPVSGYFGPQTQDAVIRFQQANGLEADGVVGPATEAALGSPVITQPPVTTAPPGTTPAPINTPLPPAPSVPVVPSPATPVAQDPIDRSEGRFSVVELQRRLQSQGFNPGPIDGVFGQQTRDAISEAQEEYGLSQSDILSP